jgi:outer membrane protein OmpA-like peptidoglycan-associated protein
MAFTALRPNTSRNRSESFSEQIHITYNTSGNWQQPKVIPVNSQYNIGTAGLSPDGQRMLIFMGGAGNSGNLFYIDRSGQTWSSPTILSEKINSRYMETSGSITPDKKTLYFASNRKGGYGGYDIYRSIKAENDEWGAPQNLGPKVNTAANEDAPFIHPDQQTLIFTSDGDNTMGGRDIFVTRFIRNTWTSPENMGYPVNSTANDNYFTLTADGRKGYFSSDRKGGLGGQDIYSVQMPKDDATIPLTMIKGKILDGETEKALPTQIYVIDNESGKKLDFVYQPDPETGSYLVILPPSKNYDMVIESEGFLPYTLNINIPGQSYFYELYQKILLKTIRQFDVVVGQEVQVQNAFYDTHSEAVADLRKAHEAELVRSDSINVYELMNDLIASGDQAGIEYLVELIQMANPIEDVNLESSEKMEQATRTYYYDESDEDKFEKKVVDGKIIFSLPTFYITEEVEKQKIEGTKQQEEVDKALLDKKEQVYFAAGNSELRKNDQEKLDEILNILKQYPQLGIEISGYASSEGNKELNRKLSNDRAIAVLNYINQKGIVRRRIVARGYGEHKDDQASAEESRRVELRIVDLRILGRGEADKIN